MDFKAMVEADNKNVFTNANEFAEIHTVVYDDEVYENIPIVLTKIKETRRPIQTGEAQGLHLVSVVAHIALEDLRNVIPEAKQQIRISDGTAMGHPFYQRYRIVTSDCEMGMVVLELEAYDE